MEVERPCRKMSPALGKRAKLQSLEIFDTQEKN